MSKPRAGTCADPGPGDAHCTDRPGHDWSCYDAGDDVSFNERQMSDWDITHGPCVWCKPEAARRDYFCAGRRGNSDRTSRPERSNDERLRASEPRR